MRQISIKQFLASRPSCSIPLGLEFKRWFDAPLSTRQSDIISLLEYHRLEKKRAPYLIIHDPHNREDVREIIEAYLHWRNEMTAPALRAALVTPKRIETNSSNRRLRSKPSLAGRVWEGLPVKHFTARSYRAAHGQTFGMVAAINCQQFTPKKKPEDGFADFPSVFIAMLDRTSPHHLLILHGCIPQGSNHSFARFMQRAAAQNAPYLIYDTVSRSFLTPEQEVAHRGPNEVRTSARSPESRQTALSERSDASPRAQAGLSSGEIRAKICHPQSPLAGAPPPRIKRECRPRRQKPNCPARGRENAPYALKKNPLPARGGLGWGFKDASEEATRSLLH